MAGSTWEPGDGGKFPIYFTTSRWYDYRASDLARLLGDSRKEDFNYAILPRRSVWGEQCRESSILRLAFVIGKKKRYENVYLEKSAEKTPEMHVETRAFPIRLN